MQTMTMAPDTIKPTPREDKAVIEATVSGTGIVFLYHAFIFSNGYPVTSLLVADAAILLAGAVTGARGGRAKRAQVLGWLVGPSCIFDGALVISALYDGESTWPFAMALWQLVISGAIGVAISVVLGLRR